MQCLIEKYKYMFNLIAFFKILNVGTHTMGDELKFCYGCNQFLSRWTVLRHAKYKTCVNTAVENIHVRKRKRRGSESAGLGFMFYFNRNLILSYSQCTPRIKGINVFLKWSYAMFLSSYQCWWFFQLSIRVFFLILKTYCLLPKSALICPMFLLFDFKVKVRAWHVYL